MVGSERIEMMKKSMTNAKARERNLVRTAVGLLATAYAATLLMAVLLHVGVEIPLASPHSKSLGGPLP